MHRFGWIILGLLAFMFLGEPVFATELGDPGPELKIEKWLSGGPVDIVKERGKKIFVIEFWATWCLPCKVTIPYLTKLQAKFRDKGVVIIGITDEKAETVQEFVKGKGSEMDYFIAIDEDKKTAHAYMKAFGVKDIPHAFVVDKKGRIAWEGHPLVGLDQALEEMVAGRYDLKEKMRVAAAKKLVPVYFYLAKETNEQDLMKVIGKRIFEYGKNHVKLLDQFAYLIAAADGIRKRELALALMAIKRAHTLSKGMNSSVADTYARVLFEMGRRKEAIEFQKKAIELCDDEDEMHDLKQRLKEYQKRRSSG